MLAVVDYDAGNLRSVVRAIEHVGGTPTVTSDPATIVRAQAVVLPGVGSAQQAMSRLARTGLDQALREVVARGIPLLGVCLGLQVLMERSEEGGPNGTICLGLLPGTVRRFPAGPKVPHMGWNTVRQQHANSLFEGIDDESYFYFVHSYYADPPDDAVIGLSEYPLPFCAALARGTTWATQFHPEKSAVAGLRIYTNFLRLAGLCS